MIAVACWPAGTHRNVGLGVLDPLDVGDEIRVGRRKAVGADDLAAALGKALGKGRLGVMAGDEVGDRGIGGLPALLGRPFADRVALLPQGE
jgi:hypothetical protein